LKYQWDTWKDEETRDVAFGLEPRFLNIGERRKNGFHGKGKYVDNKGRKYTPKTQTTMDCVIPNNVTHANATTLDDDAYVRHPNDDEVVTLTGIKNKTDTFKIRITRIETESLKAGSSVVTYEKM
jgi:hypothetical protein